jgi:hypothetical protein
MAFGIPNLAAAFDFTQAEPDSVDFDMLATGIGGDGVISGALVAAQATPDMTVQVAAGVVNASGVRAAVANGNLTIPGPSGAVTVADAAITSGLKVLTSSTAGFSSTTSPGKVVRVLGAGPSGAALVTIIDSFNSSTSVNLLTAASTTVSSASMTYGFNRFDLVTASSSGTKAVQAGTSTIDPPFPIVPAGTVALASVLVQPWTTTIISSNIIDKRMPVPQSWEAYIDDGNSGASKTLDFLMGNVHNVTWNASTTLAFTGATSGRACTLTVFLRHDATTNSYTVTWPTSVRWPNGAAPLLPTNTASSLSILTFLTVDGGTNWYGGLVGNNFA